MYYVCVALIFCEMSFLDTTDKVKTLVKSYHRNNNTIGFVPTMGALHDGHLSLIKHAYNENNKVFVSIFVNPTQFDNEDDLNKYPKTLESDILKINSISQNIHIFSPQAEDLYNGNIKPKSYDFNGLEHVMEGQFRTGHFDGVGSVLELLFELIQPTNAYFGKKDYQQFLIVKELTKIVKLDTNIIGCDIYREPSGLAMSSRNERLSKSGRQEASIIYRTLKKAREQFELKSAQEIKKWVKNEFNKHKNLTLEYVEIADSDTLKPLKRKNNNKKYRLFIAVFIENIRLIDNIALN